MSTRDTNGNEIAQSAIVTIDLGARLPAPQALTSTSLNAAIHLRWSSNAVDASHGTFDYYRVYSTTYDASRGVCTANWTVEGTTVTDAFLAGNLVNGVARCFAVSAISRTGQESTWSEARLDTPRYDAKNAFVYSTVFRRDSSGFLFFDDVDAEIRRGWFVGTDGSRLYDRASSRRIAVVRPGPRGRDDGALLDAAGH